MAWNMVAWYLQQTDSAGDGYNLVNMPKLHHAKGPRLQNLTEATHMAQNFPALRAGISPETE